VYQWLIMLKPPQMIRLRVKLTALAKTLVANVDFAESSRGGLRRNGSRGFASFAVGLFFA
jgi:hypothetical protein